MPPREEDVTIEAPPTWLAIHEFDSMDVDQNKIRATAETQWSKTIFANLKQMLTPSYAFAKGFGDGNFFHD